jgi:hypothetical protein
MQKVAETSVIRTEVTPMAWRFYRRTKILPGVSLNWSRSGPSLSVGRRGAHVTVGPRGSRASVGIPGTGISYTTTERFPLWPTLAVLIVVATIAFAVTQGWQ